MQKEITVSFEIPICDEDSNTNSSIYFNRWLPIEPTLIEKDNFQLKLWIDKDCVPYLQDEKDISSSVNMYANKVKVEIQTTISSELANFIYEERDNGKEIHHGIQPNSENYQRLSSDFKNISYELIEFSINTINRLISYTRNYDNQYWLELLSYKRDNINSLLIHWEAKIKFDSKEWFRFNCTRSIRKYSINMIDDDDYLNQNKWKKIVDYMNNSSRINLANELLSNSKSLLFKYQHRRSSVIEAVTALEVSLSSFSQKPNIEELNYSTPINRIDIDNLKQQVSHLGFSGSIRYLIPIIFNNDVVSDELLKTCYKAIEVRNNIVHQGQRDIKTDDAKSYISAIDELATILIKYTETT